MQVTCPACQKKLQSKADLSGKSVKCTCGHAFVVPKAQAEPATAAAPAAPTAKISVKCSCGKTLQAPASAAGKAVKCPCGQVVKVPGAAAPAQTQRAPATAAKPVAKSAAKPVPAMATAGAAPASQWAAAGVTANAAANPYAAPNPFGDISDDEWKSMVAAHTPKQVDNTKPKEKTAAAKMLDEARKETGQGNVMAVDAAKSFLNKTRGILVGLGILCLVRASITYWLLSSYISTVAQGEDADIATALKWIVTIFCAIDIGIAVMYIIAGFLVSFFPLTCTITALVVFTLIEIAGFIMDPLSLFSIRGWAFRIAIFGGLIQGINNAAYYRHIIAEEKAAKKQRGG